MLAATLALTPLAQASDVTINGTGVSLEANAKPIHTAKNPQAISPVSYTHLTLPTKLEV